jgi:hypothetical protein
LIFVRDALVQSPEEHRQLARNRGLSVGHVAEYRARDGCPTAIGDHHPLAARVPAEPTASTR